MPTHQDGQIIERSGAFFVRYYTNTADGRKRITHRLCEKDPKHRNASSAAVKQLAIAHMQKVNTEAGLRAPKRELTVAQFWDTEYLPWIQKALRPSSVSGYEKIWNQHLKDHLGGRLLSDYQPSDGYVWLEKLAAKLGKNTVQHVRSLASGIFTRAVNTGYVSQNPWRQLKLTGVLKDAPETEKYSLEEVENIITALVSRVDAQAVIALGFFAGLGPAEIAGLKWEDVDDEFIHVRRNVVNSKLGAGPVKSPRRLRSVLLIQPVKGLLQLWRQKSEATEGWVFPNAKGGPLNVHSFKNLVILPLLEKKGLEWKGYYALRRGCGTMLYDLTGDQRAAYQVLGNSLRVLEKHYAKPVMDSGVAGLKLLEAKTKDGGRKKTAR